ncbi:unnamed protein product [Discosporangium mesarthrocarpum]
MDDLGGTSPLQLLQDDFSSSDQEIRLKAIKRVKLVADVLGPEVTRSELIPFINKILEDDDEILLALAEALGQLVPAVGGSAHGTLLLPSLENLAATEETVVRDKAVESACTVISLMEGGQAEVTAVLKRLSTGDWFTAKVSACGLYAAAYKHVADPEQRGQLRSQFEVLSKDVDTPMVRRAAASNVGNFASVVEGTFLMTDVVTVYKGLAADDQDNVRLLAVEQSGKVAKALVDQGLAQECAAHVVPVIKHAVDDRSWRVRCALARTFNQAAQAVGSTVTTNDLLPCLTSLLQDHETEVRAAAIKDISSYVDLVGATTFAAQVMPYVLALLQDGNQVVRAALSDSCMKLAPKLGQEHTMTHILPMLLAFLRDESAEVRLHILHQLDGLAELMPAMADQVLPLVLELGQDIIWRVRRAVMVSVPLLTERMGVSYFEEHLLELYLQAYRDSVNEVRVGASEGLQRLCRVCGSDWLQEKILPRIHGFYEEESTFYLIRIAILNALKKLANGEGSAASVLVADVLELMLRGAHDGVPNVRFTAVRALQEMAPHLDANAVEFQQVRPCLTELMQSDPDDDVKFFAAQALESIR